MESLLSKYAAIPAQKSTRLIISRINLFLQQLPYKKLIYISDNFKIV